MAGIEPFSDVRLDVAVNRVLVGTADPASRVELERLRGAMASREVVAEGLDPPSLTGALFAYLMPRLASPSVLRLERRRLLLDRIAARCRDDSDVVALGSLQALRDEIANLALLRGNRDSLIGE